MQADQERRGAPSDTLTADLFLLHAPSVYDFRERDDVLFAYLSDSDSVNVTSIYEMYPIGFFSLKQRLREQGHSAEIVNLASLMLMHPNIDIDKLIERLEAPVYGFDLHWMAQCHGSIELAKRVKKIHPESLVIFGGISATYYAKELIEYPDVDIVVQGYDTLDPVTALIETVKSGERRFDAIPNLLFKDEGATRANGFTHKPMESYNDATVDWSFFKKAPSTGFTSKMIMTLPNTGCAMDCPWCGGSRYAYRNMMGVKKTMIQKDNNRVVEELRSMGDAAKATSIYALQCYSETRARLHQYLDAVKEMEYKNVFFEQFHLTPPDTLEKMGNSTNAYIMLSPESHDLEISKLAGRGNYTMDEMEAWIPRALDAGIAGIMVWFFIGMPKQTPKSIMDTVDYAERLLKKFPGGKVLPLICPMVPFLDPGSRFFENPDEHGYKIFHKTLEEHRQAMIEPLWHKRLNYETKWLSRRELQNVSYDAIGRLVNIKAEMDLFPQSIADTVTRTIAETTDLLTEMETALDRDGVLTQDLKDQVRVYNRKILAYSSDQIIPTHRPFGGRWFDDFTVPANIIAACTNSSAPIAPPPGGSGASTEPPSAPL